MRKSRWLGNMPGRRDAPTPSPSPAAWERGARRGFSRSRFGGALAALLVFAALLAGCGVPGTIHTTSTLPPARPTVTPAPLPPVAFPLDEAPHQDLTEWWYYTGHLNGVDASGKAHTYGFELVFFQTLRATAVSRVTEARPVIER